MLWDLFRIFAADLQNKTVMKKYMKILALVLTGALLADCGNKQQTEATTSNNLFSTLLGKNEAELQARIDSVWTHFFTPGDISKYDADGEKCVYYEVGDSMGIIVDTGSNDVRTEGMSYGMMISLVPWLANMCRGSGMSSRRQANGATMSAWSISSPCSMSLVILVCDGKRQATNSLMNDIL